MIAAVFERVLAMSLTASFVILAVCLARLLLKRAPKIFSYVLWSVVLFRLLCPVSVTSAFSLVPERLGSMVYRWADVEVSPGSSLWGPSSRESSSWESSPWEPSSRESSSWEPSPWESSPWESSPWEPSLRGTSPRFSSAGGLTASTAPEMRTADGGDGGGAAAAGEAGEPVLPETKTAKDTVFPLLGGIWLIGALGMAAYGLLSYGRLKRRLRGSVPAGEGIYLADRIDTPFVLGVFRPRILLPSTLPTEEWEYIVCHERCHIRRGDMATRMMAFLALCLHWFNPLVWIAFFQSGRDMEMSCDEAVIQKLGMGIRADYAASLIRFAAGTCEVAAPPAFGEKDTGERIRNLAGLRKPAVWMAVLGVLLCVGLGAGLLTNPSPRSSEETGEALTETAFPSGGDVETEQTSASQSIPESAAEADSASQSVPERNAAFLEELVSAAVMEQHTPSQPDGRIRVESHRILASEETVDTEEGEPDRLTVYALVLYQAYQPDWMGKEMTEEEGSLLPVALTFAEETGEYRLTEYWIPQDGSYYAPSIREKFPPQAAEAAFFDAEEAELLQRECREKAAELQMQGVRADMEVATMVAELSTVTEADQEKAEELPKQGILAGSSSNPGDYLADSPVYERLLAYGPYTLSYCFGRFLKGGQTDLKGSIMALVCRELAEQSGEFEAAGRENGPESGPDGDASVERLANLQFSNGQEWFDAFLERARLLEKELDAEMLEKYHPISRMILEMADSGASAE